MHNVMEEKKQTLVKRNLLMTLALTLPSVFEAKLLFMYI